MYVYFVDDRVGDAVVNKAHIKRMVRILLRALLNCN